MVNESYIASVIAALTQTDFEARCKRAVRVLRLAIFYQGNK